MSNFFHKLWESIADNFSKNNVTKKYDGEIQVIGAGYGRSGTVSFKEAIEILYNAPCYHMTKLNYPQDWINILQNDVKGDYRKIFKGFIATSDYPACVKYNDIFKAFPNAKVILTVRNPQSWYLSLRLTIAKFNNKLDIQPFGIGILSYFSPFKELMAVITLAMYNHTFHEKEFNEENAIEAFNNHINEVKACIPAEKLLIFDVKDGWEPLCKFLGKEIPNVPFPNTNDSSVAYRLNILGTGIFITGVSICIGLVSFIIKILIK